MLPCVTLSCSDVLEADELCGVSLVTLRVSFQGMSWSLTLRRCAPGPSPNRKAPSLPVHALRGHLFALPKPQLPLWLRPLSDGRLPAVSASLGLLLTLHLGHEVLWFPLPRKVERGQVLLVNLPVGSGNSHVPWPAIAHGGLLCGPWWL